MKAVYKDAFIEIRGLSSETKPTGNVTANLPDYRAGTVTRPIEIGDIYFEIDTGNAYFFDGITWIKQK